MEIQKGHAIATLVLGIIELLGGILTIILAVVAANKASVGPEVAVWWPGLFFTIPGIAGIIVGITKNNGAMITFMILNIIAFVLQGAGVILVGIIIAVWTSVASDFTSSCYYQNGNCVCRKDDGTTFTISHVKDSCEELSSLFAILTAMLVFLVIAAIIALSSSILGCVIVCCSRPQTQPGMVLTQPCIVQQPPPPAYYLPEPMKQ